MANRTEISYLTHTANPFPGCYLCSDGCLNCWARVQAERYQLPGFGYINGNFRPGYYNENWATGLGGKPKVVGINFSGDWLGSWISDEQRDMILKGCNVFPKNQYLFLTKRAEGMRYYLLNPGEAINDNFWFGVSICNQADWEKNKEFIKEIKLRGFKVWFSLEPLLGPIDFGNEPLPADWFVVGGESGHGARYMKTRWAANIGIKADEGNIPFYFKQWGDARPGVKAGIPGLEVIKQYPPEIAKIRSLWP